MTERVYLDHAATTPMRACAVEAMTRQLGRTGNASSLHASGRAARRVVEESREQIAACLGSRPAEVVFTAGGTEADNLALAGAVRARAPQRNQVVVSSIEHPAVAETAAWLAESGTARVLVAGCDDTGLVDVEQVAAAVGDRTAVVSVMWANNEVGTVQPVGAIADLAHRSGAWAHADAVQVVGHLPIDFATAGPDLLTVSGHKVGGPVGIGALLVRREIALQPVLHGGGQERDIRSGTVDVASVAGFAAAVTEANVELAVEARRLRALRTELVRGALRTVDNVRLNGPGVAAGQDGDTLPSIVNLEFVGCEADALLMVLDAQGIDCSTGSACTAGVAQPSEVLMAMGRTRDQASSALRFSLGATTTRADVEALLAALPSAVASARDAAGFIG